MWANASGCDTFIEQGLFTADSRQFVWKRFVPFQQYEAFSVGYGLLVIGKYITTRMDNRAAPIDNSPSRSQ